MVSGLAPGSWAETWIVGKSICGSGATGSSGNAAAPVSVMPSMISEVATGRAMKMSEKPICRRPGQAAPCRATRAPGTRRYWPLATTASPGDRPAWITAMPSAIWPTCTGRMAARPSSSTV